MITFVRWFKRGLLFLLGAFFAYQLWLLAWVLAWRWVNPDSTRFMEIRHAETLARNPKAVLRKEWVEYGNISTHLKRAVVTAEDDLFVRHDGFDWKGIQIAMEKNQQRGKIVAGGSTITQQLAKNLFLTPEKTPWRKAQEAILTVMIEMTWPKRRILEVYLNVIEWGQGVFGAEAAAQHYYGIRAAQLAPEQAANLAAMIPSPRYYDRNRSSAGLANRSEMIRSRMTGALIP